MRAVLRAACILIVMGGATASVAAEKTDLLHCGKDWVAFRGILLSEHIGPENRFKQAIFVRKSDIRSMAVNAIDGALSGWGYISVKDTIGQYQVDTVDLFDVVACLD